jgi:hypothetical protein
MSRPHSFRPNCGSVCSLPQVAVVIPCYDVVPLNFFAASKPDLCQRPRSLASWVYRLPYAYSCL